MKQILTFPQLINWCSCRLRSNIKQKTDYGGHSFVTKLANTVRKFAIPFGFTRGPNALKNQRWLLSFFLFCSFKQKIICTGHAPCETSPVSVTTTLEVYLRWTVRTQSYIIVKSRTQRYEPWHPSPLRSLSLCLLDTIPSIQSWSVATIGDGRISVTRVSTWSVRLFTLLRPSDTTQTTTFFHPSGPHVFDLVLPHKWAIFLMTLYKKS